MLQARVRVDASRRIGAIDPNIYGHFIEHLGRCINGGIWGEMLQARKFVGFDEHHRGLPTPWGSTSGREPQLLTSVEDCGERRRVLRLRSLADDGRARGVGHGQLAVRRGTTYLLEMQVRAEGGLREVEVGLGGARVVRPAPGGEWERWEVELPARRDSDDAALVIACHGRGDLLVRAPSLMRSADRATGGFRADVIDLVGVIAPPVIRWPGGCFADGYRWRDGIGPRDERPTVFDPAWEAWEPNDFGTDEFVTWCRLVGAAPYICVNTGSADAAEAAAWVEYCNGPADSRWGRLRADNGHAEPFGVRYWSIGNETYGGWEIGNIPADEYGRLFVEFAAAMREADPGIKLIAVGADPIQVPDWNRTVLEIAGERMDHLSVHRYVPHARDDAERERQYEAIVAAPVDVERRLRLVTETIEEVLGPDGGVTIAFDEWNVWLDAGREDRLEERYALRDALFAAGVFNALHRACNEVAMANLAQLVNVLPAIVTSPTGAWGTPIYHAFRLYVERCREIAVACECESPTFDAQEFGNIPALAGVPFLDASATVSADGSELALAVVNRHRTEEIEASIAVSGYGEVGAAEAAVLDGPSDEATTDETRPSGVAIHHEPLDAGADLSYRFPPHSATVISLARRGGE